MPLQHPLFTIQSFSQFPSFSMPMQKRWCYSYISSWVPSMPFHSLSWHYLSHFLLQPHVLFPLPWVWYMYWLYFNMYYSTAPSVVGWIHQCRTPDIEGQLWSHRGFQPCVLQGSTVYKVPGAQWNLSDYYYHWNQADIHLTRFQDLWWFLMHNMVLAV